MLSEVNRRSYRQGMSYDVANIVFHDSDTSETFIKACTAPNTWALQAAWQRGFNEWMKQQRVALDAVGQDEFGPWHDFKVYLNNDHIGDPDKAVFVDCEDNTLTSGEWVYSKYLLADQTSASQDPDTSEIVRLGPHTGTPQGFNFSRCSLLEALENTLQVPQEDPSQPATADESVWGYISGEVSDPEITEHLIEDYREDNDLPGYSPTIVPGAGTAGSGRPSEPWIIRECCIPGGGAHMAAVGGFTVPCGLLMIETTQASDDDKIGVTLELVPGDYKGVSARPMRGGGR